MSNEFIVGNVWIAVRNMHWNVHLKSDPRIPGHKPWFSSFRSELNPCPLPAHTNTFPHGALTRHKPHHHPSVQPDLPGHEILPLLFSLALFTSFPFCLPSQPVTRYVRTSLDGRWCQYCIVPCVLISYCFVFGYGDGCVGNLSAEDVIGFLSRFRRLKSFHAMTIVYKKKSECIIS